MSNLGLIRQRISSVHLPLPFVAIGLLFVSHQQPGGRLFELTGRLSNSAEVRIAVKVAPFPKEEFLYKDAIFWGADSYTHPSTYVESVRVFVDDKSSWVRLSSYSDLANVVDVRLRIDAVGFHLELDGGETATHYTAIVSFDNEGFLKKRRVSKPSFENEVWETTEYSFIRRKNM